MTPSPLRISYTYSVLFLCFQHTIACSALCESEKRSKCWKASRYRSVHSNTTPIAVNSAWKAVLGLFARVVNLSSSSLQVRHIRIWRDTVGSSPNMAIRKSTLPNLGDSAPFIYLGFRGAVMPSTSGVTKP